MKKSLFFSLVLLAWAGASAQIRLAGVVVDAKTNQPVVDAVIMLAETNALTESKADGSFYFEVKKPGRYTLNVVAAGYERNTEKVELAIDQNSFSLKINLNQSLNLLRSVEVSALRASAASPLAFTDINKETIEKLNSGRDMPFLLEQTPGVVATSDAGAGIGYTNIRVRGSDITRINVTVNGIPINDAESNGVFWVNMPDLASSTNSIQLQRGVGTSTNGGSAFGATLNMETDGANTKPSANVHVGLGSFNTQRYTAQFGTGILNKNWWMGGRLSQITSDGYIDRATSKLQSYYLSGGYIDGKTSVRAVIFGGREKTYQAWYGVDSATMATNRTFNFAGAIFNDAWEVVDFYDNQIDNYSQDHYQLHLNHVFSESLRLNVSLHYTKGAGYFEEYIQDADMAAHNLPPLILGADTISTTNLVRQKWLDNDFFGGIFNFEYTSNKLTSILGGGAHRYLGNHFGEVIWAQTYLALLPGMRFYQSDAIKNDMNVFWKNLFAVTQNTTLFLDLQVRTVAYSASGTDDVVGDFSFEQNFTFFNPKVGVSHTFLEKKRLYASLGVANREPNRTDLIYADPDNLPKPERLYDFELGIQSKGEKVTWDANAFLMYYQNQLVLTGALDAVGFPIRENIGQSYRIGIELSANWQPLNWLRWSPNITYMNSQNLDFVEDLPDGTVRALGNTAIAYSPNSIIASTLEFFPIKNLSLGLFTKYVGSQYLNNSQTERLMLNSYLLNDVRVAYSWQPMWIEGIEVYINALNIFGTEYASNGYVYAGTPYFYPQAGLNFIGGLVVSF
jgi:iron complex outermembrane receptor protein